MPTRTALLSSPVPMGGSVELLMFEHLLARPDADINIEHLALVLCELDRPGVNIAAYLDKLDVLGELARIRLRFTARVGNAPADRIVPILRLLYGELGFHGNTTDYYDHRNSYLNDVIDRRTGNPLTLAVLLIGVCRRAGIRVEGISFPGHFLVRVARATGDWMYIDPFDGRVLNSSDLRSLYESATEDLGEIDERYLAVATCRQMIMRMLNNLRAIYELHGDQEMVSRIVERLGFVTPRHEVQRRPEAMLKAEALGPRLSLN